MIGILYICTGKYDLFWKDFYLSAEKFFVPSHEKTYFVFTDAEEIYAEDNPHVKKIYQKPLSWPYSTLMRYEMFSNIRSQLEECEYIFFFNANIIFLDQIDDYILPDDDYDGLVAVIHPFFWDKPMVYGFSYERDKRSTAAIEWGDGKFYVLGGINGGKKDAYLQLIDTIKKNIEIDLKNDIIALWHDESHFNRYILDKNPLILNPSFGYPEEYNLPFTPIISIIDKSTYGGQDFLREQAPAE